MATGIQGKCCLHGLIPVSTVLGRWHSVYGVVWGEQAAYVNVVNRVPHGGGGVMVWAGISYGQ